MPHGVHVVYSADVGQLEGRVISRVYGHLVVQQQEMRDGVNSTDDSQSAS